MFLLLTQLEGRTVNFRPSFLHFNLWPEREALGSWIEVEKQGPVSPPYLATSYPDCLVSTDINKKIFGREFHQNVVFFFVFRRQIMRRFEIDSTPLRIPKRADRLEARGVFATNQSSLQKQAFPLLSNVKLGPYKTVSYKNMAKYLLSKRETAPQYSSLSTFLQDHLTPEGLNFLTDLIAFPPYFAQEPNAETFFESLEKYKHFTRNFILPHKGVSALTDALKASVIRQKGKIYKDEEVKTIDELGKNLYSLKTARFKVIAKKLVLAVPMKSMQKIHGSLAGKIKNNPIFKSIGYQVAYKMIALYEKAWWKHNSSTSWRLNDEQNCRSNSDCLGYTFPYRWVRTKYKLYRLKQIAAYQQFQGTGTGSSGFVTLCFQTYVIQGKQLLEV